MSSPRMRIVVDPTVLLEAVLEPRGDCGGLLRGISQRRVDLVLDDAVRARLASALHDPEARALGGWDAAEAERWIDAIDALALREEEVERTEEPGPWSGGPRVAAGDRVFFELARRTGSHLVSTDPATLAGSGGLGVDVLRPDTVNLALSA